MIIDPQFVYGHTGYMKMLELSTHTVWKLYKTIVRLQSGTQTHLKANQEHVHSHSYIRGLSIWPWPVSCHCLGGNVRLCDRTKTWCGHYV